MNLRGRRRGREAAGFTLLEALIATAILGVALVSLLGLHARDLELTARAQDLTTAALLASSKVAEIKAGGFPDVGTTEGDFQAEADRDEADRDDPEPERFRWKTEVAPTVVPSLRLVVVSVGVAGADDELVSLRFVSTPSGVQ